MMNWMLTCRRVWTITPLLVLLLALSGCFSAQASFAAATLEQPYAAQTNLDNDQTPTAVEPTPVPDVPLHELSIETLRTRTYTGSDFVIEQTLDPGINYNRYIVSYLSDGLKIYALLTVPWGEKPSSGFPVVIFNHGYIPPEQYRTTERYVAYVDAFARNGYIVVRSDYRGHGDSEGDAQSAYGSPGYVIDVLNALASVRRYPDADPNRIGMWGHSMGGYITLRAMVVDQDIKAGVIWAGVVASYADLFANWMGRGAVQNPDPNPRRSWRSRLIEDYGTPDENPAFWDSLSANSFLTDLSGPVQLHHGTADTSVPVEYSTTLEQQILSVGGSVELFLYPGDDHNISVNRDDALTLSVVFFDQHVKASQ